MSISLPVNEAFWIRVVTNFMRSLIVNLYTYISGIYSSSVKVWNRHFKVLNGVDQTI